MPYQPVAEPRDARYPFALNTGRLRDQWHGMSRTGTLGTLFGHVPEPALQMHPQDLQRRQLTDGDLVHVTSRRGSIVVPVQASDTVALNQVFLAMHWGSEALSGRSATGHALAGVNALTNPAFCPDSKQPELKHAAVKVLKAELPWGLVAMAWLPARTALSALQRLREHVAEFDFASCVPFGDAASLGHPGGARQGVVLRAACATPCDPALLRDIEQCLGLDRSDAVRYADAKRGQWRTLRLHYPDYPESAPDRDARLEAFLLAGDTRASAWIAPLVQHNASVQAYGRALLIPGIQPPVATPLRGATVCNCFGIDESTLQQQFSAAAGDASQRLGTVQQATRCGTNCGSCLPQLQRMARAAAQSAASMA